VSEKYVFIDSEYANLARDEACAPTVTQMCEWLRVSNSGFYGWRSRPVSETARRRELLKIKIQARFEFNNEAYGYRRIHAALVRGGESVDDETVRKIMRDLGLVPCQPRPWRPVTTIAADAGDLPDLLRPGDLLVANRSRVLPARILGRLSGGGRAEFLLLRQHGPGLWEALARPARRLPPLSGTGPAPRHACHLSGATA